MSLLESRRLPAAPGTPPFAAAPPYNPVSHHLKEPALSRSTRNPRPIALAALSLAIAAVVSGCGLFTSPSPAPSATGSPAPTPTAGPTGTPGPTARVVTSIAVVAAVADGAAEPESPSGLAWTGAQQAATTLGAAATLAAPKSQIEAAGLVETAASGGAGIVVAVGPDATRAAVASAAAHPGTQFFMVDVAPPPGSPANLHGLVFDEAQAGYLAAIVATAYSKSGHVAMIGDSPTDARSTNYLAGFRAGAPQGRAGATVTVSYAGTADSPEKARTAVDTMIKGKADVILALPDVSGIAAMREACARKALVVAADSDAWQLVPDVRPCLIAGVRKRYDLAVAAAVLGYASGAPVAGTIVGDVAGREIELTDLHVAAPAGLADRLASVLQVMQAQPAGASPVPASS